MNTLRSTRTATIGLALAGLAAPAALASDATTDARIAALEAEVARLRAEASPDWIDARRAREIELLVHDALSDASTRSSLLQSGGGGGYDGGFMLAGNDAFTMKVNGLMQVRYLHSLRENSADDSVGGFENTNTRLSFSGTVVDPSWIYMVQMNAATPTYGAGGTAQGAFTLEDAYVAKVLENGWILGFGQVRVPMLREDGWDGVDEANQLGAGRSMMSNEFGPGRTQGLLVKYAADQWRFSGAFTDGHDGTGGSNTAWNTMDVEASLTGRFEYLLEGGSWDAFATEGGERGQETSILLGGAIHHQWGEHGTTAAEVDATQWTVDITAEFDGATVSAWYVDRNVTGTALDGDGLVVQGSYFLTDDLEAYGRFELGSNDVDPDDAMLLTLGVNRSFGPGLRLSADLSYAFEQVTAYWSTGTLGRGAAVDGFLTDATGEDGQIVFRTQLSLAF